MSYKAATQIPRDPKTVLILIGINHYLPGSPGKPLRNSGGKQIKIRDLRGAVEDVESFHQYALNHPELKKAEIFKLTSPAGGKTGAKELPPTYRNIIEVFDRVTANTLEEDIIHIHFSCHGVRVKTKYPDLKGEDAVDEAIAPMDIQKTGQCLRDVQLNVLIRRMVNKGAHVSIVCDCCHSGSVTRGDDDDDDDTDDNNNEDDENTAYTRTRSIPDYVNSSDLGEFEDPHISLPQDDERIWKAVSEPWKGPVNPHREAWLQSVDYDLFAACHLHMKTFEDRFEGKWHGLFTQSLLTALMEAKTPLTHSQIHRKLSAVLREDRRGQTPIFSGNGHRHFLSRTVREHNSNRPNPLSVINVNNARRHVILSEGRLQGVTVGSIYAVYPWFATNFDDIKKQPMVKVIEVNDSKAKAEWTTPPEKGVHVELGSQAVLYQQRLDKLRIQISLLDLSDIDDLQKCASDGDVVELVEGPLQDAGAAPAYLMGTDDDQAYRLLDVCGKPIPQFPTSRIPEDFMHNLSHLARYQMLRDLTNPFAPPWLRDGYKIQLTNTGAEGAAQKMDILKSGHQVDLQTGEVQLMFTNKSEATVYLTVFDFSPWWSVNQIFPNPSGGEHYSPCEPAKSLSMKFPLSRSKKWPDDVDYIDHLKLFIVGSGMSFNTVHLPELGEYSRGEEGDEEEQQSLQGLLDRLGMPHRCFGPDDAARTAPWLTVNLETRTIPPVREASPQDCTHRWHQPRASLPQGDYEIVHLHASATPCRRWPPKAFSLPDYWLT